MPNNPPDRGAVWLAAVGIAVLVSGAFAWRNLSAATAAAPPAPQTADLDDLARYLKPVSDSAPAVVPPDTVVVLMHDPFERTAPAVADAGTVPRAPGPPGDDGAVKRPWIVNAVLITGSYRAAIINDSLVTLGNRLPDGTRLTAVERDHVILTDRQGTKRTITVRDGNH